MQDQEQPKDSLLCEDANALEVTTADGQNQIVKTVDRERAARELLESKSPTRPSHSPPPKSN